MHEWITIDGWYKRLGHPLIKLVQNLDNLFSLPLTTNKVPSLCISCSINKVHQQSFGSTKLQSHSPLKIIYIDVWRRDYNTGLNVSLYYLLFVDHYTKYMWFYSMPTKSLISKIFINSKNIFCTLTRVEFLNLKKIISNHGISHYNMTFPTHLKKKRFFEWCHFHMVEMELTLLHDANLSLSYWPHAFQAVTYLINSQPTLLFNKSPFKALFGQCPNHVKLRKFGFLCYLLTRSYNIQKL